MHFYRKPEKDRKLEKPFNIYLIQPIHHIEVFYAFLGHPVQTTYAKTDNLIKEMNFCDIKTNPDKVGDFLPVKYVSCVNCTANIHC